LLAGPLTLGAALEIPSEVLVKPRAGLEGYKGLSQGEMAKRMGIGQAAYSQMERPGSRLRKATRGRIAEAMGIPYQQLEE